MKANYTEVIGRLQAAPSLSGITFYPTSATPLRVSDFHLPCVIPAFGPTRGIDLKVSNAQMAGYQGKGVLNFIAYYAGPAKGQPAASTDAALDGRDAIKTVLRSLSPPLSFRVTDQSYGDFQRRQTDSGINYILFTISLSYWDK